MEGMLNRLGDFFLNLLKNRFSLFFILIILLFSVNYFLTGSLIPDTEQGLWFYSGLFMLIFSLLFIEPYYTSPKNVITNAIPLLLVFLAIKNSFENPMYWWIAIVFLLSLLIFSVISISVEDRDRSKEYWKNKLSDFLKKIVVFVGQGKFLYSAVFIYFLLSYYSIQDPYVFTLFVIWFVIVSIIDPKKIKSTFTKGGKRYSQNALGEIFAVQSENIFLVKVLKDRENISKFNMVEFLYSVQKAKGSVNVGIIFDIYFLDREMWIKILCLNSISKEGDFEKNIVYKITNEEEKTEGIDIDNFVGIIREGSNVGKIKFEYSENQKDLQDGDLLELKVQDKRLFYQVTNGVVESDKLRDKNESGFIIGEAIQLGEWKNEKISFQKFGWVPAINTPIFKANTTDIKEQPYEYPSYKLGVIPGTSLPSVINLSDAVSHHMALLGVTGSGKSFLAQEIIKELQKDTKVICVDFTGEWKKMLDPAEVEDFMDIQSAINNDKVSIIELEDVSNTTESLTETERRLQDIFSYAKNNEGCKKICLILEEAHTIVPETSFLGDFGDYSANKALVNKMSQIALQGRKHGVGLLVIAQRTANVSKTVLTQCNTVVCFQAFDETSFNFLGNYIGKDLVQVLPNLKQYHAVVTGKAIKSNLPMIVDLTKIQDQKKEKGKEDSQDKPFSTDDIPF